MTLGKALTEQSMRLICTIFAALFSLWCASAGFAQEEPAAPAPADDGGMRQFFFELLKEGKNLADKGYYYEACVAFNGVLERGDSEIGRAHV